MVVMDSSTGGALGIISILFSGAGLVYAAVNHKRIRCRCCGKDLDVSVDVDSTEPVATAEADGATAPEPEPEPESEPEPETPPPPPPPKKARRSSLPPIVKKPRTNQIIPEDNQV